MGAMQEVEWGEGRGVMHINCSVPKDNVLVCDAEERVQKWKLSNDFIFSKIGILSNRIFHTKGVSAKKYYEVHNGESHSVEKYFRFEEDIIDNSK